MVTSTKLTDERMEEIKSHPIVFDDDIPEFTDEELREFVPVNPEHYKILPKQTRISIKLDTDLLEALKSQGKGYQTRINEILRAAVLG